MSGDLSELVKKALALPPDARASLAGTLLESLEGRFADQSTEDAWSDEIKRRIDDIESGRVRMIPYEEVRRRLAARLADAKS